MKNKTFEVTVLESLSRIEARVSNLEESMKKHSAYVFVKFAEVGRRFEAIEETIAYIPGLYDNVDKLLREVVENREHRTFTTNRINGHELRIAKLEGGKAKASSKPSQQGGGYNPIHYRTKQEP